MLLALIALGIPLALSLRDRVNTEVRSQAQSQAAIVAASSSTLVETPRSPTLARLARISARTVRGRVIVVDRAGTVVADSGDPGTVGASYSSRPEIAVALRGGRYQRERSSQTLGTQILATSQPIVRGRRTVGAVRITQSVAAVQSAIQRSLVGLGLLGIVVLALALAVGAVIAQQIARPIRRLETAAHRVATGNVETKAKVEGSAEQRSLARSFNEMTARVARLLKSQSEFVADASHQLRTPLTGLRLRLEGLREETDDSREQAEIDAGLREVDRLSQMVDELLILSRAGEHELPGENLDLGDLAGAAFDRWSNATGGRSLGLREADSPNPMRIFCARADFDRVLDALIENAVNYSPPDGEIVIAVDPGMIQIFDQGPGLEAGEEEAVFERFVRGSAGRRGVKGTGLGLPIARELVGQWGGTVTIAGRPGQGAVATVKLPEPRDGER